MGVGYGQVSGVTIAIGYTTWMDTLLEAASGSVETAPEGNFGLCAWRLPRAPRRESISNTICKYQFY